MIEPASRGREALDLLAVCYERAAKEMDEKELRFFVISQAARLRGLTPDPSLTYRPYAVATETMVDSILDLPTHRKRRALDLPIRLRG